MSKDPKGDVFFLDDDFDSHQMGDLLGQYEWTVAPDGSEVITVPSDMKPIL